MKNSILLAFLLLTACQSSKSVKLIFPDKTYQQTQWTQEELEKDFSIRHLFRSPQASTHLIRLNGDEVPHYHDYHDLNVTVLSGKSIIHFKDHQVSLEAGDVLFIPKGTYHWAEKSNPDACVIFAVFAPAFDGKDRRFVEIDKTTN